MTMILDGTNGAFLPTWTTATRPANVVAICNTAWTEEVKSAYKAMLEQQQNRFTE